MHKWNQMSSFTQEYFLDSLFSLVATSWMKAGIRIILNWTCIQTYRHTFIVYLFNLHYSGFHECCVFTSACICPFCIRGKRWRGSPCWPLYVKTRKYYRLKLDNTTHKILKTFRDTTHMVFRKCLWYQVPLSLFLRLQCACLWILKEKQNVLKGTYWHFLLEQSTKYCKETTYSHTTPWAWKWRLNSKTHVRNS